MVFDFEDVVQLFLILLALRIYSIDDFVASEEIRWQNFLKRTTQLFNSYD